MTRETELDHPPLIGGGQGRPDIAEEEVSWLDATVCLFVLAGVFSTLLWAFLEVVL